MLWKAVVREKAVTSGKFILDETTVIIILKKKTRRIIFIKLRVRYFNLKQIVLGSQVSYYTNKDSLTSNF